MSEFQLFVSYHDGDLDPHQPHYICAKQDPVGAADGSNYSIGQLYTQIQALESGTAPYLGVATEQCFLDITKVLPETGEGETTSPASFSKAGNVDLPILESLGYGKATGMPAGVDVLLPQPASWLNSEYMSPTYRHVMWYWWHRKNLDLDTLKDIFASVSPQYIEDLEAYRTDDVGFPFGTFIMRADLFKGYSTWMLTVTEKYLSVQGPSEDMSWVESLAPQIIARHLLAIYVRQLQRNHEDCTIAYAACTYFEHMDNPYLQPAFDRNNVAVVLAADAAYASLMSVTIESILRNATPEHNYDLVILDAGLSNADFEFLQQQVQGYDNVSLRFLHLRQNLENRGLPTLAHISITTFARFLILDFMASYSKVVYLDTDLVCTTDIAELYETDVEGYLVAAVRDTADAGWSNIVDNHTRKHLTDVIQLSNVYDYFNAGVLVMNVEALSKITSCQALMETSLDTKWLWMDQDVLNNLCAGKTKHLDQAWNFMAHKETYFTPETTPEVWLPVWLQKEYKAAHDNPKIVHYAGRATPCFSLYSDSAWYFWDYAKTSPYYEILVCTAALETQSSVFNPISQAHIEMLCHSVPVSVIVPVYNAAPYLAKMLNSLLRQTHKTLEIVCVNDGSEDASLEILHEYASRDSRVVVVNKENSGAGLTRNVGMEHANGKYIWFVDSDDFIEKDAVEQLVRVAEKNELDVVVFGMDQYDDTTGVFSPNPWAVSRPHIPSGRVFYAADIDNFYKHLVGFTVNKFYRAEFLSELNLRFPSIGAHEDMPFTYIALSASKKSYFLDKTLYHYRRSREGSLSDSTSERPAYMLDALEYLRTGLIEHGLWNEYERSFVNYALHMCVWKHSELSKFKRLEFRDSCRRKWFDHFGMSGHSADYFFDSDDYAFLEDTINLSFLRKLVARCYRYKLSWSERAE